MVLIDEKKRYYAHCAECNFLAKIKNPTEPDLKGLKFLGYLRHCLSHQNKCKNGSGESRLERTNRIVLTNKNRDLIYENGNTGNQ